jgi:hypothetical protein
MPRIVIVILICHRHKPVTLISQDTSLASHILGTCHCGQWCVGSQQTPSTSLAYGTFPVAFFAMSYPLEDTIFLRNIFSILKCSVA